MIKHKEERVKIQIVPRRWKTRERLWNSPQKSRAERSCRQSELDKDCQIMQGLERSSSFHPSLLPPFLSSSLSYLPFCISFLHLFFLSFFLSAVPTVLSFFPPSFFLSCPLSSFFSIVLSSFLLSFLSSSPSFFLILLSFLFNFLPSCCLLLLPAFLLSFRSSSFFPLSIAVSFFLPSFLSSSLSPSFLSSSLSSLPPSFLPVILSFFLPSFLLFFPSYYHLFLPFQPSCCPPISSFLHIVLSFFCLSVSLVWLWPQRSNTVDTRQKWTLGLRHLMFVRFSSPSHCESFSIPRI